METQKTKRSIESYNNGGSSISRSYSKCPLFLGDTVMGKVTIFFYPESARNLLRNSFFHFHHNCHNNHPFF